MTHQNFPWEIDSPAGVQWLTITKGPRSATPSGLTTATVPDGPNCTASSGAGTLVLCCSESDEPDEPESFCITFTWPVPAGSNDTSGTKSKILAVVRDVERAARAADAELKTRGKRLMTPFDAEERALVMKHLGPLRGARRLVTNAIVQQRFGTR